MDRDGLKTRIASRLNRSDLAAELDGFIASAEDVMNAVLSGDPVRPMATTVSATLDGDEFAFPDDLIDIIQLRGTANGDTWEIVRANPGDNLEWMAARALPYGDEYSSLYPKIYRVVGSTGHLPFAPDADVALELDYFQRIPPLAASNTSNWMLANHSLVYEFGALAAAYAHLRDDAAEAKYKADFLSALSMAMSAYPEKGTAIPLRMSDGPLPTTRWSILNG